MAPTDQLKFALEVYPADWRFPAGDSWIAGWIVPAVGQSITDVRVRLHHRVILGLFGLPHPAFAEASRGQTDAPGYGFSFFFEPHSEAKLLRIETRNGSGQWAEIFRTEISVPSKVAVPLVVRDLRPSLNQQLTALIKHQMRNPTRPWPALADDIVTAFVVETLDSHPNAPFVGELEEPREFGRLEYGRISITGWLGHPTTKIIRLAAVIDPQPATHLPYGLARLEISKSFPALGTHGNHAFVGELALPPDLAAPILLKIFAELDDGQKCLVFARRFGPKFAGTVEEMTPMVPAGTFTRAAWELFRAADRHSLSGSGIFQNAPALWAAFRSMPIYRSKMDQAHRSTAPLLRASESPSPDPAGKLSRKDDYRAGKVGGLPTWIEIGPADDMCVPDASHYFQVGREALALVQSAARLAGVGPITAILDLPSGYGRIARWFRTAYPGAQLTVSDTQQAAVTFCVERLGTAGVLATVDGSHWKLLPGPFDIIWCGSLLTHFDADEWVNHLHRFSERLAPNGVLVFTSHGLPALDKMQSGEKDHGLPAPEVGRMCAAATREGFGYAAYIDTPQYGISIAQPGWIRALIARETNLRVMEIRVAAWGQHQDVVACQRRDAPKMQ